VHKDYKTHQSKATDVQATSGRTEARNRIGRRRRPGLNMKSCRCRCCPRPLSLSARPLPQVSTSEPYLARHHRDSYSCSERDNSGEVEPPSMFWRTAQSEGCWNKIEQQRHEEQRVQELIKFRRQVRQRWYPSRALAGGSRVSEFLFSAYHMLTMRAAARRFPTKHF
jgi:hypothetical protein